MMLSYILSALLRVFELILMVYCVFSWFVRDPYNKFYVFLSSICDPLLNPIRTVMRRISFFNHCPIDISPILLAMLISLIYRVLL